MLMCLALATELTTVVYTSMVLTMNSIGIAVKFGINTTLVALKIEISPLPHDFYMYITLSQQSTMMLSFHNKPSKLVIYNLGQRNIHYNFSHVICQCCHTSTKLSVITVHEA